MGTVLQDVRFGIRMALKNPVFTILVVLTLALGIGANTAIFSIVDAVLFRPLPVQRPEEVVRMVPVHEHIDGWSYPGYLEYRKESTSFSGLAAFVDARPVHLVREGGEPQRIDGAMVSGNYFDVLGIRPEAGRLLTAADDEAAGAGAVAVISDGLWRRAFGGEAGAVGQSVRINGQPFTIIGVAPAGFFGASLESFPDLWVPLTMVGAAAPSWNALRPLERRGFSWLSVVGRLRPGVSAAQAQSELTALSEHLAATQSEGPKILAVRVEPAGSVAFGVGAGAADRANLVSKLLLGVVALVLLLACADAAGLLLVRAERRGREVAIRLAIGASRSRIVRQMVVESLLLAILAAAGGLLLASWTVELARALAGSGAPIPLQAVTAIGDSRILGYTLAVALVTGILFGLVPALHASRTDLVPILKNEGGTILVRRWRLNLREGLVLVQVALAAVLLVGAGLLLRTLFQVSAVNTGFAIDNRLVASVDPSLQGYADEQRQVFYAQLLERLQSLPGVRHAALAGSVPVEAAAMGTSVEPEGFPTTPDEAPVVSVDIVTPDFFTALEIPVVQGRAFTPADTEKSGPVIMVNESFAKRFWPGQDAIGKRVLNLAENGGAVVVGIVRDARLESLRQEPAATVFFPLTQFHASRVRILLETEGDPRDIVPSMTAAVGGLDSQMPLFDVRTMRDRLSGALAQERLLAGLLVAFAGLALVLAVAGLYGVTAYGAELRTREWGIRMALGAPRSHVMNLALRRTLALGGIGLGVGLFAAIWLTRLFQDLLYGVKPSDFPTFAGIAALLGVAALVACSIPARRATKVAPLKALRWE